MAEGGDAEVDLFTIGVWQIPNDVPKKKNEVNFSNNTIDGVPLRKLYIKNIPHQVKQGELQNLFTQFGTVERVDICRQLHAYRKKPFAFVTFKTSNDAIKALKRKFVPFGRHRLVISPAYAYCQPSTNDESSDEEEVGDCEMSMNDESILVAYKPNTEVPIENLDDYCLRHIFSYLPYLERLKLERVCRRWKSIARAMWRLEQQIDLPNNIPFEIPKRYQNLLFLNQLFKRCGSNLKKLNLQGTDIFGADGLIEAIVNKCTKLEELRLQGQYLSPYKANSLKVLNDLKVFSVRDCNPVKDFNLASLLSNKSQLTELEVSSCSFVNGSFLKSIHAPLEKLDLHTCEMLNSLELLEGIGQFSSTLKHLCLSNCQDLDLDLISEIVEKVPELESLTFSHYAINFSSYVSLHGISNLKKLQTLNLSFNRNITYQLLKEITVKCQQLTSLDISASEIEEDFTFGSEDPAARAAPFCISGLNALKNLRNLNLSYQKCLDGEIIRKYASKSPPIESLYLIGCDGLADADIKSLFTSCYQLKHLDLSGCSLLTEETVKAAEEALNLRTNNQPLHLVVGGTQIKEPEQKEESSESKKEASHPLLTMSYVNNKNPEAEWFCSVSESDDLPFLVPGGNFDEFFHHVIQNEMYFDSDDVSDFFDDLEDDTDDDSDDDFEDYIDGFFL